MVSCQTVLRHPHARYIVLMLSCTGQKRKKKLYFDSCKARSQSRINKKPKSRFTRKNIGGPALNSPFWCAEQTHAKNPKRETNKPRRGGGGVGAARGGFSRASPQSALQLLLFLFISAPVFRGNQTSVIADTFCVKFDFPVSRNLCPSKVGRGNCS